MNDGRGLPLESPTAALWSTSMMAASSCCGTCHLPPIDEEVYEQHLVDLSQLLTELSRPYVVVIDLSHAPPQTAKMRSLSVDFWKQHKAQFKRGLLSLYTIATNRAARGLAAAFCLGVLPCPVRLSPTVSEAIADGRRMLEEG